MAPVLTLALAQLNPTVGDLVGNIAKLRRARAEAAKQNADLLVTAELYLCGYPPEDLVLKPSFQHDVRAAIDALAKDTADGGPALLLGTPWHEEGKLFNAAVLLDKGKIVQRVLKKDLPNYGPFDEKRIFTSFTGKAAPLMFQGHALGVMICEDMWTPPMASALKKNGADILLVINGSPFDKEKRTARETLAHERVNETGLPLLYLNQVGGQDELVFDGASFSIASPQAAPLKLPPWEESMGLVCLEGKTLSHTTMQTLEARPPEAALYAALVMGLRDYVTKNGFLGVVLGLSGGIDSAVAAALAVDALGKDHVWSITMPSPYTAQTSLDDATALAHILGCRFDTIPIHAAMTTFDSALAPVLGHPVEGITKENIQARSRGLLLMALSNTTGFMVLSTGNKSELSVGYATLYGDMCGGFSVLKDVYKTDVYKIARWRNAHTLAWFKGPQGVLFSESLLTKAPSAELRPNQTDQDSLPAYDILDGILTCLIEKDEGIEEIKAKGYNEKTIEWVWRLLDGAEYKRRQAPPGVKITSRNLSRDRRYPITNKYRPEKG
ncbi:MAG: NAD+ synthase [Alphaproteobacteria bacterium]|nr:NAD+ synthase [Alphaproteobacteria bacterium]